MIWLGNIEDLLKGLVLSVDHYMIYLKKRFVWTNIVTSAFEVLKGALVFAPILAIPDCAQLFVVLMQQGHPIAYISKSLSPKHQAMCVYDRELLALIFVVTKWSQYLLGKHFIIKTDQKALKFLLSSTYSYRFSGGLYLKAHGF